MLLGLKLRKDSPEHYGLLAKHCWQIPLEITCTKVFLIFFFLI